MTGCGRAVLCLLHVPHVFYYHLNAPTDAEANLPLVIYQHNFCCFVFCILCLFFFSFSFSYAFRWHVNIVRGVCWTNCSGHVHTFAKINMWIFMSRCAHMYGCVCTSVGESCASRFAACVMYVNYGTMDTVGVALCEGFHWHSTQWSFLAPLPADFIYFFGHWWVLLFRGIALNTCPCLEMRVSAIVQYIHASFSNINSWKYINESLVLPYKCSAALATVVMNVPAGIINVWLLVLFSLSYYCWILNCSIVGQKLLWLV